MWLTNRIVAFWEAFWHMKMAYFIVVCTILTTLASGQMTPGRRNYNEISRHTYFWFKICSEFLSDYFIPK